MLFVQWNLRGFFSKLHWLQLPPFSTATVLVLQETFLKNSSFVSLRNKKIFRVERSGSPGGGLVIAVSTDLPAQLVSFSLPSSDVEVLGVKLWIGSISNSPVTVVNVYSPRGFFSDSWLDSLFSQLSPPFLILGDFNIHHPALGSLFTSADADTLLNWISINNMCLLNMNKFTRFQGGQNPALLDLSICSADLFSHCQLEVSLDQYDSDHCPIFVSISGFGDRTVKVRSYINWRQFSNKINDCLDNSLETQSIEALTLIFHSCSVSSSHRFSSTSRQHSPWWDAHCNYLKALKRRLLRRAKSYPDPSNWSAYKKMAARLRKYIKTRKRKFWERTCEETARSHNAFRIIKAMLSKDGTPCLSHLVLVSGVTLTSPVAQANAIATSILKKAPKQIIPMDFSCESSETIHSRSLNIPFTINELKVALSKMRNKSPGKDGITKKMISSLSHSNLFRVLGQFNELLSSAKVPESWRMSKIIPILKPGKNASEVNSYRPIALTSVLCKLFERMLLARLLKFFLQQNFFSPFQAGFLPYKGCDTLSAVVLHKILSARARKHLVYGISFDLKAAYDNVWHDGLMFKMLQSGVRGHVALWIFNFLLDRKAFVSWRGISSSMFNYNRGVPQGSVLSPLFFTVFMQDIFDILPDDVTCFMYADDIFLLISEPSIEEVKNKIFFCIARLESWCQTWHMEIAPQKSSIINFSSRASPAGFHVPFGGTNIPWASSVRFLGIRFDDTISFRSHIDQIKRKALRKLNVIKAFASPRWGASASNLLKICNACILQSLEYGAHAIGMTNKAGFSSLQTIHNQVIRFCFGLPRWTPIPILHKISREVNITLRFDKRFMSFFIKQCSTKDFSAVSSSVSEVNTVVSNYIFSRLPCGAKLIKYFNLVKLDANKIIPTSLPVSWEDFSNFFIRTQDFDFQQKSLVSDVTKHQFSEFRSHLPSDMIILASDASKSTNATAIAAVNFSTKVIFKGSIHNINSVFTGEGLALALAISKFTCEFQDYMILTDSKSNLSALSNINFHSPKITLFLARVIAHALSICKSLQLVYTPAHVGIHENECADTIAKNALNSPCILDWISPEDATSECYKIIQKRQDDIWQQSKYCVQFHWLDVFNFRKITLPRRLEVLILRFITKTLPVNAVLHKCRLVDSPDCGTCLIPETCEHLILSCSKYDLARDSLRASLGCIPLSYDWLCDFSFNGSLKIRAILASLCLSGRF
ncbi:RNA-directed DNA polymerase from mobile element jockey [Araneus ventricosus]|uniref:RNA-directed DNA polymerase from mobile element jockey n=1 Tax=Araneus ventricosus TaxID=182803 RepID=A0A4Y2C887_ARAVE|nr:RNA-directed DNA polymerase from mobile element jockey [Araneus ventricosus]